jgi:hypothetical protein
VPPSLPLVAVLAKRYSSKELGDLTVLTHDGVTTFALGEWKSTVASRKNDDGTTSFITIDPGKCFHHSLSRTFSRVGGSRSNTR